LEIEEALNNSRFLKLFTKTRIGVYIDAYNLYYGARKQLGSTTSGWRWLDFPALLQEYVDPHYWPNPKFVKIIYCTALRQKEGDSSSMADQQVYIEALRQKYSNLSVEYGYYVKRHKTGILVGPSGKGKRVLSQGLAILPPFLPIRERQISSSEIYYDCTISTFEEKGSDVNVAAHLLRDIYAKEIDAAIVVSNDSDLRLPIAMARSKIQVGLVNPTFRPTSRDLQALPTEGVGGHWWHKIASKDFTSHQLAHQLGDINKPQIW
jgi:uncharacterized LabA/DUF88 family protein